MLRHLTACCRPASPPLRSGPVQPPGSSTTTPSSATTIVDLSRFDAKQLSRVRPRALVGKGTGNGTRKGTGSGNGGGQRLELRFPAGMTGIPQWASEFGGQVMDLPAFAGLSLDASHCRVERLEVGGDKVRLIRVPEGCEVSVPSAAHVGAVRVEWVDPRTGARRTGRPWNHINRVAQERSDAAVPRNCSVSFKERGYERQRIECRHIAAYIDRRFSDASNVGSSTEADCRSETRSDDERAAPSHRLAGIVRNRIGTVAQLQAEIPHAYEARFFNLTAQSPNAAIVDNNVFPEWIRRQFEEMSLPDRRTYLLVSRNHAMNLALTTRPATGGAPVFEAIFLDPNLHTQPCAMETGNEADIAGWSLERFIGAPGMSIYYPLDVDGAPVQVSTLIRTPRGRDRLRFDTEADRKMVFEPSLSFFPEAMPPEDLFETHSGLLGSHQRTTRTMLDRLPPDRVFSHLHMSGLVSLRMGNGAADEITTFFETVAHLVEIKKLDVDHAMTVVTGFLPDYPFHNAVLEGRPEALERYRRGLEAMMDAGWLTGRHRNLFRALSAPSALRVVDEHAVGGTSSQKDAADRYRQLLSTLDMRIGAPDPEAPVSVRSVIRAV